MQDAFTLNNYWLKLLKFTKIIPKHHIEYSIQLISIMYGKAVPSQ